MLREKVIRCWSFFLSGASFNAGIASRVYGYVPRSTRRYAFS
ncbi:hypothetical protein CFter6_0770 [Collimonas fungivorans]|uniref:Uncharacterized protein n=1 Tax=Collimonas fungivorans TaxID=158899 RepID=A0A127P752_9BURK|nr:hypothetical protein CFter6_0770 [Collimonas fungivorans]